VAEAAVMALRANILTAPSVLLQMPAMMVTIAALAVSAQKTLPKLLDFRCHVRRAAYPVNRVAAFENPDCVIRP
jgi:hypothetical protein